MYVDEAVLPDTTPSGYSWDVDLGFGRPDPYVTVIVGAKHASTATQEDTFKAYWGSQTALPSLGAVDLRAGITFEVWDADITFDDYVGSCTFAMADSDFNRSDLLTATCDTPGLELYFHTGSGAPYAPYPQPVADAAMGDR